MSMVVNMLFIVDGTVLTSPGRLGGSLFLGWRANEGVADSADRDAIFLDLSPQTVNEGLDRVLGGSI